MLPQVDLAPGWIFAGSMLKIKGNKDKLFYQKNG